MKTTLYFVCFLIICLSTGAQTTFKKTSPFFAINANGWAQENDTIRYKGVKACFRKEYRLVNGIVEGDTSRLAYYYSKRGFMDSSLVYRKDFSLAYKYRENKIRVKSIYGRDGMMKKRIIYTPSGRVDTIFSNRSYYTARLNAKGYEMEGIDSVDRNPGKAKPIMGLLHRMTYSYDSLGRRTEMVVYDKNNRLDYSMEYKYDKHGNNIGLYSKDSTGKYIQFKEIIFSKDGKEIGEIRKDGAGNVLSSYIDPHKGNSPRSEKPKRKYNDQALERYRYTKRYGKNKRAKQYTYTYIRQFHRGNKTIETYKESKGRLFKKLVLMKVSFLKPDSHTVYDTYNSRKDFKHEKPADRKIRSGQKTTPGFKKAMWVSVLSLNADSSTTYEKYHSREDYQNKKPIERRITSLNGITLKLERFFLNGALNSRIERNRFNEKTDELEYTETGDTTRFELHLYNAKNLPYFERYFYSNYKMPFSDEPVDPLQRIEKSDSIITSSYEYYEE